MSSLRWQLTDDDRRGVAYLGLSVSDELARSLLRGGRSPGRLQARVTKPGRFADILGLGFPGLFALSSRFASALASLEGLALTTIAIEGGPDGYSLLGVTGRCGPVDYRRSTQLRLMGTFVELRGLFVDEPARPIDFAVPDNRESILVSERAAEFIRVNKFDNIRLRKLEDVEFAISQDRVSPARR